LPTDTPEHLAAIARHARRGHPLAQVALTLFVEGYPITEQGLRDAYAWAFAELDQLVADAAAPGATPFEQAEAFATQIKINTRRNPFARALARNLRGGGESPGSILLSALTHAILLLTAGEGSSEEAGAELAAAAGLIRLPDQSGPERLIKPEHEAEAAADFSEVFAAMRFPALADIAATAPLDLLEHARDNLKTILRVSGHPDMPAPTRKPSASDPLALAVLVPALIVVQRWMGDTAYANAMNFARRVPPAPRNPNWGGLRRRGPVGQPGGGITSQSNKVNTRSLT
jgi:hypothetical protein